MAKHVEDWKLSKNADRKHRVYVREFPSANVKCMKDYVKYNIGENNPNHVIKGAIRDLKTFLIRLCEKKSVVIYE